MGARAEIPAGTPRRREAYRSLGPDRVDSCFPRSLRRGGRGTWGTQGFCLDYEISWTPRWPQEVVAATRGEGGAARIPLLAGRRSRWRTENRQLKTGRRLDTKQPARFLSSIGILLESGRREHGETVLPFKPGFRIGVPGKAVSSRKQTAVGFHGWMRARDHGSLLTACGNRAIQRGVWPEPGPGAIGGLEQAESIPGDRFLSRGCRFNAGAGKG